MKTATLSVEVITLPMSNIEQAIRFYGDQMGSKLDVDYSPNDAFRVAQFTPPGSGCSIQFGKGLTDAPAGSVRNGTARFIPCGPNPRRHRTCVGLVEARRLFKGLLGAPVERIVVGNNASLALMHDIVVFALLRGFSGGYAPWPRQGEIAFLCPVPGYDRSSKP